MLTKAPNPPQYTSSGEEQRSNREPMSLSPMSIRSLEVSGSDDAEIEDASAQAQKSFHLVETLTPQFTKMKKKLQQTTDKTIDERVHLLLGMTSQMGDVLGGLTEVLHDYREWRKDDEEVMKRVECYLQEVKQSFGLGQDQPAGVSARQASDGDTETAGGGNAGVDDSTAAEGLEEYIQGLAT